jgi:hypothetical protein
MAGIGPDDLYLQSQELLEACIDSLDQIPVLVPGLLGAPERAFVSPGRPALDCCDQLAVNASPTAEAPTVPLEMGAGTRHQQQFRKNYVAFNVWITRCADLPDFPPSTTVLEETARQTYADAWALWNLVWNMARAGDIFSICGGVYFDRLQSIGSQGGCDGWVLALRAEVEGFEGTP